MKEKTNTDVTQGPQGTVSTVVISDQQRMLDLLCDIKQLFDRINPTFIKLISVRSILILCVENIFSEMKSGSLNMPLQLQFDTKLNNQQACHNVSVKKPEIF